MNQKTLETYIRENFAHHVNLTPAAIFEQNWTLVEIIAQSDQLQNSIDLMEAFAKTANGLKKEYGIQVRLPAFSLDTDITTVLEAFLSEVQQLSPVI